MNVFILATCRNPELWPATAMVFKTLRRGFPNWPVTVFDNGLQPEHRKLLEGLCDGVAATIASLWRPAIHHVWIEHLLNTQDEPFVILDTDVALFDTVEGVKFNDHPLVGRLVPVFRDEFTKCITLSRLHTSLLFVNPAAVKRLVNRYFEQFPVTPFNPRPNLIHPGFIPYHPHNYFFDTCCLLYQAIHGQAFTPDVLDRYGHLNFGTISDIVSPHYPDEHFRPAHFYAFENPEALRGQWRKDDLWYAARSV